MSFLDIDLGDAKEPKAVAAGEYQVRLTDLTSDNDKNGNPYILARLDIPSSAGSKDFTQFMGLPRASMTEKEANNAKWRMKTFFEAFGIDHTKKIDLDTIKGKMAWAILGVKPDDEYGDQNYVKKWVHAA
jgi:hypothetical protein